MSKTLFDYMKEVQRHLHDSKQTLLDPEDIITYINQARRQVAMQAQCLRVLPAISGAIIGATVTAPGTGYTNPTITITPPDFPNGQALYPLGAQATGTATQIGGVIQSVNIDFGGSGYFQPQITINDPTGTGATATPLLTAINQTYNGQEIYNFSSIDLTPFPGIASILAVKSVSIIYANYRYSLPRYAFSVYQSQVRQYPLQYQYVPTICSQYGQGIAGSMYMYPLASASYQMEWDCICLPSDLLTDLDYEAIPDPWTDAVGWFAAYLAYLEIQNANAAAGYLSLYEKFMSLYGAAARIGGTVNPYGRY